MIGANLSLIGIWLLVFGVVLIIIEGAMAGIWSVRLARRSQRLSARLVAEQRLIQADVDKLRAALAETQTLWQPYARALRYLRHPLVAALIQSYASRRAGPR